MVHVLQSASLRLSNWASWPSGAVANSGKGCNSVQTAISLGLCTAGSNSGPDPTRTNARKVAVQNVAPPATPATRVLNRLGFTWVVLAAMCRLAPTGRAIDGPSPARASAGSSLVRGGLDWLMLLVLLQHGVEAEDGAAER